MGARAIGSGRGSQSLVGDGDAGRSNDGSVVMALESSFPGGSSRREWATIARDRQGAKEGAPNCTKYRT
jgi:hypothetical protein